MRVGRLLYAGVATERTLLNINGVECRFTTPARVVSGSWVADVKHGQQMLLGKEL